jgi:hypothetical protein
MRQRFEQCELARLRKPDGSVDADGVAEPIDRHVADDGDVFDRRRTVGVQCYYAKGDARDYSQCILRVRVIQDCGC